MLWTKLLVDPKYYMNRLYEHKIHGKKWSEKGWQQGSNNDACKCNENMSAFGC